MLIGGHNSTGSAWLFLSAHWTEVLSHALGTFKTDAKIRGIISG